MDFEKYLTTLPTKRKLSGAKSIILKTLWADGSIFPGPWVKSSSLLAVTKQKYFDRRARELRDELGCDIETKQVNGEHCWRIVSTKLSQGNTRQYLTEKQKNKLFQNADYKCSVCGRHAEAGVRGLQADHKEPLLRGGSHEEYNWQAMCNECNVGKRRACEGCQLECLSCSWAYPEKAGVMITAPISTEALQKIDKIIGNDEQKRQQFIQDAIYKAIES